MIRQTEGFSVFQVDNAAETVKDYDDLERLKRVVSQIRQIPQRPSTKAEVRLFQARGDLFMRAVEVVAREIYQFNGMEVKDLSSRSGPQLLVKLAEAALTDTPVDRTNRMALKGADRFRALLDKFGGSVSTKWVCEFLGITESAVRKRAQRKTLLAHRMPNGNMSFPRFQFNESAGDLVQGLRPFLAHVKSWQVEDTVRFLLVRKNPSISDENPFAMLKQGQLQQVIALAVEHLTQRP